MGEDNASELNDHLTLGVIILVSLNDLPIAPTLGQRDL